MTKRKDAVPEPSVEELDRLHVWHPYTQHRGAAPPLEIVRAEGAYLYDRDGRAILDGISSWWVTLHGHAHPAIARAIAEQARTLDQVIFAGHTHEPAARLAAELIARMPAGLTRVFYSDNGSTAVEVAVKMALQFWANRGQKRKTIVALERAYHGDTFGAMSVSARGVYTEAFSHHLFRVERLPAPALAHALATTVASKNRLDLHRAGARDDPDEEDPIVALDQLLERKGRDIAAVIVEPMLLGAGGMHTWSADVLRALRARAKESGILFIADEVLTGFGRTGPLFACEHAGIAPDIVCLSKGLTGGFLPLGATVATEEVFAAFLSDDRRRTLFHGHSYTANPIACAAARASLALLDDSCASARARIEAAHRKGLTSIMARESVANPRVLGTVAAFDITSKRAGYLDPIGPVIAARALEEGILLRPLGNVVYVLTPYCVTDEDLKRAYRTIGHCLDELE